MSYTVLARRYRSRDFDELVGQEAIARTLRNAIETDRVAHAYLFCGTRGVGKTSMARIFAKALNATDDLFQREEVASAIMRGEDLDVIEIDGASNRGIDAVRDLIAGASLSPARSRYKIYIIDEVHQITKDAFNALLKTMEEPPSHVKFILCTTEPEKVPPTIQSRCQRFDFKPLRTTQIADQLRMILQQEGLEADEDVVLQIARLGNGSMRDALSLLDRLLAAGEKRLTGQLVEQMLGLPDQALISNLVDSIIAGDARATLRAGADLLATGASVEQALEQLTDHFRDLLVIAACGVDTELVELSQEAKAQRAQQAGNFDAAGLVHLIALCDAVSRQARGSAAARALFDAALVRLAMSEHFADVSRLLNGSAPTTGDGERKKKALSAPPAAPVPPRPAPAREAAASPAVTEVKSAAPTAPTPADADQPADVEPNEEVDGAQLWQTVCERATSPGECTRAEGLAFREMRGRAMHFTLTDDGRAFAKMLLASADAVAEMIRRHTGRTVRVVIDHEEQDATPKAAPDAANLDEVRQIPAVREAMDVFDATIVGVRTRGEE